VGVETLAYQGEILTAFQHLRLHEPPSGGGSSYRCSTGLHPELLHATKTFLKAIRYTGVAMVEFKVNEHTGQWAFIEINGRFWGSLPLALAAGADFPYFLYQMWIEGKRDFPQDFKRGVSSRNLVNDLRWMRANWRADKNDPALMTVPWRRVARELISLFTLREYSDTLVRDDPGPGLLEIWQHTRAVARSAEGRIVSLFLSRLTVRERQATRLRNALREAKRVLFVCKGNICRSPFAHRLAETLFPQDLAVASAGYYQQSGRRCPAEAIQIAAEMGVDLRAHRSEVLSASMLEEADVVLIFDSDNYLELRRCYTWVMPKVHLVGTLADRRTAVIRDPYGGTHADFRAAYAAIHESLTAVAKTVLAVTPPAPD
jgi:protein-tyrosine-phosphatase